MKRLLFLLLFLPVLSYGQFLNVGNTWQRQISGSDTTYRMVMGGPGYWYPYTRKQIDNKFVWLTTNQTIAGNKTFTGETVTGLDTYSSDLTASFVTRSKIDKGYADGRYVNLTTTYSNPVFVNTLDGGKIVGAVPLATTVTTNANLTGDVTSVGNATTYNAIVPSTKGGSGVNNAGTLTWGAGGTLGSNAYTSTAYLPLTAGSGSPLSGILHINKDGEYLRAKADNIGGQLFQSFYNSLGTRRGYIGYGISSSPHLDISNEEGSGGLNFLTNSQSRYTIDASGNNTWTGSGTFGGALSSTDISSTGGTDAFFNANRSTSAFANGLRLRTAGTNNWLVGTAGDTNWLLYNYGTASNSITVNYSTNAVALAGALTGTSATFSSTVTAHSIALSSTPATATANYDLIVRDNSGGVDDGKLKVIASTALPTILSMSTTIDIPSLSPGANYTIDIAFTGVASSDPIVIGLPPGVGVGGGLLTFSAFYSAANQITFTAFNASTASTIDITSATYKFKAIK